MWGRSLVTDCVKGVVLNCCTRRSLGGAGKVAEFRLSPLNPNRLVLYGTILLSGAKTMLKITSPSPKYCVAVQAPPALVTFRFLQPPSSRLRSAARHIDIFEIVARLRSPAWSRHRLQLDRTCDVSFRKHLALGSPTAASTTAKSLVLLELDRNSTGAQPRYAFVIECHLARSRCGQEGWRFKVLNDRLPQHVRWRPTQDIGRCTRSRCGPAPVALELPRRHYFAIMLRKEGVRSRDSGAHAAVCSRVWTQLAQLLEVVSCSSAGPNLVAVARGLVEGVVLPKAANASGQFRPNSPQFRSKQIAVGL